MPVSKVPIFLLLFLMFFCCRAQIKSNDKICKEKFAEARSLAEIGYIRPSALDSAMVLLNECLKCDSIKVAVVEFKLRILIQKKNYYDGLRFIDSLNESDFIYPYKKNFLKKNFEALNYASQNDIVKSQLIYKQMSADLERYISEKKMSNKEFEDIYIELFEVKQRFLDKEQIKKEVEDLKKKYPDKINFFSFFEG
jgi:hypothetical protein